MEASALIRYQKSSVKKLKYISSGLIGLHPELAAQKIAFSGKRNAELLSKAIISAYSNYKLLQGSDSGSAKVLRIEVNKGPMLKRWNPVSRGMAHSIKKPTCHIKVVVGDGISDKTAVSVKSKKANEIPEKIETKKSAPKKLIKERSKKSGS